MDFSPQEEEEFKFRYRYEQEQKAKQKGLSDEEGMDLLKSAGRGALSAAEFVGSIPGAVAGGVAGLGHLGLTTGIIPQALGIKPDVKGALDTSHKVMEATSPSQIVKNFGEIVNNLGIPFGKDVSRGVDSFRESPEYREIVERPMGSVVMGVRDLATAPARMAGVTNFDTLQGAENLGELGLIGTGALAARGLGGRARPRVTPEQEAFLRQQQQPKPAPEPVSGQMELPLQQRPEPSPVPGMMDRVQERMLEAEQLQQREALNRGQPDMFAPEQPRESFPGIERAEQARVEKLQEGLPYEDARLAPELDTARYDQWRENTRITEMRGDRPTIDFPLRFEAWESDPYVKTLAEEYNKHSREHRIYSKRHGTTGYAGDAARAERAYQNALETVKLAETYATKDYGISTPDHFSGSLWADKPTALPIETTNRPALGTRGPKGPGDINKRFVDKGYGRIEKSKNHLASPIRRKQAGQIDIKAITERLFSLDKLIKANQKSIEALEAKRGTTVSAEALDRRLEKLYYEQMKLQNEKIMLADNEHPLHNFSRKQLGLPEIPMNKGKLGRQRGTIDLEGLFLGIKGVKDLPTDLQNWVSDLALDVAMARAAVDNGYKTVAEAKKAMGNDALLNEARPIYQENLNNPDFVKQAIANSGGWEGTLNVPINFGTKGKIGRQEGAIKWQQDPEYRKFKDSLPEPMKANAKEMYKRWLEMQQEAAPEVLVNEGAGKVVSEIPGVKGWKEMVETITKSPEELKPEILKEPDLDGSLMARAGRQLISGAKMLGMATQNTMVRYAGQIIDTAFRKSYRDMERLVFNDKTGVKPIWEKLNDKEFAETWAELAIREGTENLTKEQMYELGFSDKQIAAAEGLRSALDAVYDILNAARAAVGKRPFDKRLGYIPSRFRGDWVVEARDASGSLVHMLGGLSERATLKIKEHMQAKHPELTFSEPKHEPMHRFKDASDVTAGYQTLIEMFAEEDPRVQMLEQAYNEYLKQQAYSTLSVKKHFRDKKGVGGAEGFKDWQEGLENAHEGMRSIMNYMDHATKWAHLQESFRPLRQLMKDPEIVKAHPNTLQYTQAYIDSALGRSTRSARAFDSVVDFVAKETGIGQALQLKGIREVKKYMTAMYLGVGNLGFSLSQFVQVVQTVPAWMTMLNMKGANASITMAYMKGAHDAYLGWAQGREALSPEMRGAWEYAKEHGIVKPHILDEFRTASDKGMSDVTETVIFGNMTYPEKIARTQAYMAWVHFLKDTGQFKGKPLYEAAANLVDLTMVDYRQIERPMLYKQFGTFGEMANALTTFKHNYFSQMYTLGRQGGVGPLAVFVGMSALLSGALGLPGREDLDSVIKLLNLVSPVRIPTTREWIMRRPDWIAFGGISAVTGMDLSGKFSSANVIPDDMLSAASPFLGTLANSAVDLGRLALDPSTTNAWRLLYGLTPNSLKGGVEELAFRQGAMMIDPKTLQGKVERNNSDKLARGLALRSTKESRELHKNRTVKEQDTFYEDRRMGLVKSAKDAIWEGNKTKIQKLAQKYAASEGDVGQFIDQVVGSVEARQQTEARRVLESALENPLRARRIQGVR
jgi:hypothetical protein